MCEEGKRLLSEDLAQTLRSPEREAALCSGFWEQVGGGSPLRAGCGWHPASEEGVAPPERGRERKEEAAGGWGRNRGRGSGAGREGHAEQAPRELRAPVSYSPPTALPALPGKPPPLTAQ